MADYFLGIDVGTGSARAGLFTAGGHMVSSAVKPIAMNRPRPDFVEQSSADIWKAVCEATRQTVSESGVNPTDIRGIGFDATCSLVAIDPSGGPVTVSPDGDDFWNVIVWMDHRAMEETAGINAQGHDVLRYVGGRISPEMEAPKLLWLKRHLPESWKRAAHFFDLPDFLTWKATASTVRSLCSTVCKWTYLGHETSDHADSIGRWDPTFWHAIGLGELADEEWRRIGTTVRPMGEAIASGLSETAAREMGLQPGTAVGVSIIDAHAGGIGVLGARIDNEGLNEETANARLALIGGTSSCHMAVAKEARFVEGIWGPYYSAMVPGLWLNEGGQTATGSLIDHVIHAHSASAELREKAAQENVTIYENLNAQLEKLASERSLSIGELTASLHLLPYFHGNRSPRADASLRGMIVGLSLERGIAELALHYLAAIQGVAHGTRHIIEELNRNGYAIDTICACGGGTKNPVFLQQHADITGCRIVLSREPEAVLLGSAILGVVASRKQPDIESAMAAMAEPDRIILPQKSASSFHAAKHRVFHEMHHDFVKYRSMMEQ